jgi:dihydroorotate dehydrogenase (NAD+) catalytic subunit
LVHEAFGAVKVPILGLGGIETAVDVLDYLVVGASAVQVGTAHFADPGASCGIVEDVEELCKSCKINEISSLRGIFASEST